MATNGKEKGKKDRDRPSGAGLKLIQHKHCSVCGKAQLVQDPEYCSADCKKTLEDNVKKKRMWWIYFAILMLVIIIIMFGSSYLRF